MTKVFDESAGFSDAYNISIVQKLIRFVAELQSCKVAKMQYEQKESRKNLQ